MHVAPVVYGKLHPTGFASVDDRLQVLFDGRRLSGPRQSGDEEVISGLVQIQAELDGPDGPVLPDESLRRSKLVGTLEGEIGGVTRPAELLEGDLVLFE